MFDRISRKADLGRVVTCAGLGAASGAALIALVLSIALTAASGRLEDIMAVFIVTPLAIFVSMFTAWPAGALVGSVVSLILGAGMWQAALTGALTGLLLAWIFGFTSSPISLTGIAILVGTGPVAGLFAWRTSEHAGRRDWSRYS